MRAALVCASEKASSWHPAILFILYEQFTNLDVEGEAFADAEILGRPPIARYMPSQLITPSNALRLPTAAAPKPAVDQSVTRPAVG